MGFTAIPDQGRTREANLEFLQRMHLAGATLEKDDLRLLEKHEYLTAKEIRIALERPDEERFAAAVDRYILSPEIYLARCIAAGYEKKWKGKEIKRSDWKCEDPAEFDKDFQSLILSTTSASAIWRPTRSSTSTRSRLMTGSRSRRCSLATITNARPSASAR